MKLSREYILNNLHLDQDNESVSIYISFGGERDIIPICYWHFTEWEEDAETVVPVMLRAVTLFYEDKETLLETLDYDIDNFNYI